MAWSLLLLAAGALESCASKDPAQPSPSITGHVVLVGHEIRATGQFAGTHVTALASGVRVDLMRGGRVEATTSTTQGRYHFEPVPDGLYTLRARVVDGLEDSSAPIQMVHRPIEVQDTLRLLSAGDLLPLPNPFADTLLVSFGLADPVAGALEVTDLAGNLRRTLLAGQFRPGSQFYRWDGRDRNGAALEPGYYWLVFTTDLETRAQLLIRQ